MEDANKGVRQAPVGSNPDDTAPKQPEQEPTQPDSDPAAKVKDDVDADRVEPTPVVMVEPKPTVDSTMPQTTMDVAEDGGVADEENSQGYLTANGYVGVDPMYQNAANNTDKPLQAESGPERKAEDRAIKAQQDLQARRPGLLGYTSGHDLSGDDDADDDEDEG